MTRKGPKSDIFFGTNDRLTYFLMQFPERKAYIDCCLSNVLLYDFFFNVDVLKLCVMRIFFDKIDKNPYL